MPPVLDKGFELLAQRAEGGSSPITWSDEGHLIADSLRRPSPSLLYSKVSTAFVICLSSPAHARASF